VGVAGVVGGGAAIRAGGGGLGRAGRGGVCGAGARRANLLVGAVDLDVTEFLAPVASDGFLDILVCSDYVVENSDAFG
jgi:hypothetical protein